MAAVDGTQIIVKLGEEQGINNILEGATSIGAEYDKLFRSGNIVGLRGADDAQQVKYQLEIGAVFSAGQLLGYFAGSGLGPEVDLVAPVQVNCGVGGRVKGNAPYPGLSALQQAAVVPDFRAAFQRFVQGGDGGLGGAETMMDQISDYICISQGISGGGNPAVAQGMAIGLNNAATAGYDLGLSQGRAANNYCGEAGASSGGRSSKKKRGGRRKNMRGGALTEDTQLNLLTTALILGGIGGAWQYGIVGLAATGFDYCYRQGRSILYALNWLKRPCITDSAIISGLIFKSIPGFGAGAKSCLQIAEWNKVMNTALLGIVGTVYSTAIALGARTITGKALLDMPEGLFSFVKENVSKPVLKILKYIGDGAGAGTIAAFQAISNGAGGASEKVRQMAQRIRSQLMAGACTTGNPADSSDPPETVAAAVVTTNEAAAALGDDLPADGITDAQEAELKDLLAKMPNMTSEDKTAFVEAVKLATQLKVQQTAVVGPQTITAALAYDTMKKAADEAAQQAEGDDAAKQAVGTAAFIEAFKASTEDAELKKKIYDLMDAVHKGILDAAADVDTSGYADEADEDAVMQVDDGATGGRKRKTRRRKNKKRKTKTMRKKKTRGRGRKAKRKTKGKKSKARRKTRSYRR